MPEIAADIAALEQVPFFGHLDEDELRALVRTGRRLSLAAGRTIFRQGDEPDGMYVLLAGRVRLVREDPDGDEVQVAVFEPARTGATTPTVPGPARRATSARSS